MSEGRIPEPRRTQASPPVTPEVQRAVGTLLAIERASARGKSGFAGGASRATPGFAGRGFGWIGGLAAATVLAARWGWGAGVGEAGASASDGRTGDLAGDLAGLLGGTTLIGMPVAGLRLPARSALRYYGLTIRRIVHGSV